MKVSIFTIVVRLPERIIERKLFDPKIVEIPGIQGFLKNI
jgi:hypothetical protein